MAGDERPRTRVITPYLCVRDAKAAIAFYRAVFDAEEVERMRDARGRVSHCELRMDAGSIYLADEFPEFGIRAPQPGIDPPVIIDVDVTDVQAFVDRALALGATLTRPLELPDHGLQTGRFRDPFGHIWLLARWADE